MAVNEVTTKSPASDRDTAESSPVTALTIISHPDLSRIGERALLHEMTQGRTVELSRSTPSFAPPGKVWGRPLDDVYLSRRPLLLRSESNGILIERGESPTQVIIGGEPLDTSSRLSDDACNLGVDIELARRIVLLIHRFHPATEISDERYDLVGDSEAINMIRATIGRIADLDVPVLLRGESGTGKELVAKAIHESGSRRDGPFVAVNLGAVPPSLAAAELFGAVKGAYTGAVSAQKGYFKAANAGTLFLDEVGDCPAEVQTLLLRTIETSEVFPVGSQSTQRVDVRLVAATDSNLEAKAIAGEFKEPLLHRLSAYDIWMAPLRERRDDIGRLMAHFAIQAMQELGKEPPLIPDHTDQPPWIPSGLAAQLTRYLWPGNVRQLRNLVWQLVIDSRDQSQLVSSARVERLLDGAAESASAPVTERASDDKAVRRRPGDISEDELVAAMRGSSWEPAGAARRLGISRPSLYDLVRKSKRLRTAEDIDLEEIERCVEELGGDVDAAAQRLEVSTRGLRRRMRRLGLE
jgi:two-component system nitrogen regulation response regulator GlnG